MPLRYDGHNEGAESEIKPYAHKRALAGQTRASFLNHFASFPQEQRPRDFHARFTRRHGARGIAAHKRVKHRGRRLALLAAAIALPAFAAPVDWSGEPHLAEASAATPHHRVRIHPDQVVPRPQADRPASFLQILDARLREGLDSASRLVNIAPQIGPAAQPLVAGGSALSQGRALQCLTQAIYYEAASESDDGQRAVAQVVLNRVTHPQYPHTVCGVVFQGSWRKTGCQFSFTCDGSLARQPSLAGWARARRIAADALAGYVYRPVGLATHYHTIWVNPYWAPTLTQVTVIGAHRFYRWPGAAGLPGAFTAAYLGAEPVPTLWTAAPIDREAPAAEAITPLTPTQEVQVIAAKARANETPAPNYSAEIKARGGDALYSGNNLPGGGEIRPEFARSGEWIGKP